MTLDVALLERLRFLQRVTQKEAQHLRLTDARVFAIDFSLELVIQLDANIELSERVEAFVSRFGRLQDTLGDKLLPALLSALGEKSQFMVDNLLYAERMGLLASAESWLEMRQLRNQMVHEYIESPAILHEALLRGHGFVPTLIETLERMSTLMVQRGWIESKSC